MAIEDAGALIVAGVEFTDLNSGLFTQRITRERTIELGAAVASVGDELFAPLSLPTALRALTALIAAKPRPLPTPEPVLSTASNLPTVLSSTPLTQDLLWNRIAAFVRTGDILVADQGTSFYGMATHRLPRDVTFIGQPMWASIGYSLPATMGACLAVPGRRGVLLIGDGAAQVTLTELASMIRFEIPVVVVVDNNGYTVERAIHGPDASYNDIARLDRAALPAALGPTSDATGIKASTVGELVDALTDATAHPARLTLIQVVLAQQDVPPLLEALARAVSSANQPTAGT